MEILSVTPIAGEDIRILDYFNGAPIERSYRRYLEDCWEVLLDNSWEELYFCEELENLYQEWRAK
jgi:hypothetical protein